MAQQNKPNSIKTFFSVYFGLIQVTVSLIINDPILDLVFTVIDAGIVIYELRKPV